MSTPLTSCGERKSVHVESWNHPSNIGKCVWFSGKDFLVKGASGPPKSLFNDLGKK